MQVIPVTMHKKWLNQSISERLEWYTSKFDNLLACLTGKKPSDDEDAITKSRKLLKKIKDRMEVDRESGLERTGTGGKELEEHLEYYEAIEKASKKLPKSSTDREQWFEELEEAKEIVIGVM